jgi:hypothetical protein
MLRKYSALGSPAAGKPGEAANRPYLRSVAARSVTVRKERLRLIVFNGRRWLPIWLPGTGNVSRAGPRIIVLPDERVADAYFGYE